MIYIAISIFLFNILVIFFKLFEKYNIDNLQALLANYIISAFLALYLIEDFTSLEQITKSNWIYHALIIGVLFISIFNLYALSIQKVGIAITSVINKMSFIIPVIASIILYKNESLTISIIIGVSLALIGIYLSSTNNTTFKFDKKYLWLIMIIFFGQGIVDVILNDSKFHISRNENMFFFLVLFISASITGILILIFQNKINTIKLKNLGWGILFGIPNFFSIHFFLKALQSNDFINKSYLIFPLTSVGIVVTTTLVGVLIYKEVLSKRNVLGIFLAIISIMIISL
jgi:drug/metabolite transporter (DMT)-like permease